MSSHKIKANINMEFAVSMLLKSNRYGKCHTWGSIILFVAPVEFINKLMKFYWLLALSIDLLPFNEAVFCIFQSLLVNVTFVWLSHFVCSFGATECHCLILTDLLVPLIKNHLSNFKLGLLNIFSRQKLLRNLSLVLCLYAQKTTFDSTFEMILL